MTIIGNFDYTLIDNTAIVFRLANKTLTDIRIDETVELNGTTYTIISIEANAFSNKSIESITIPKTVTSIGNNAFSNSKLKQITIPDDSNLISIGDYAFSNTLIESITIPKTVTSIGNSAFSNSKLKQITIPDDSNLVSIGGSAFSNTLIESITIPKTVTSIGNGAFENSKLKHVYFKGNKPKISIDAFGGIGSLFNPTIGHFDKNDNTWKGTFKIDQLYFGLKWYYIQYISIIIAYILLIFGTSKLNISTTYKIPLYVFITMSLIILIFVLLGGGGPWQ